MLVAGRVAGFIGIRFTLKRNFRQEEIELTRALVQQATLAIQLTLLSAQSRQSAVMAERNRMARDIHDTLAQGFTGVIVQLEAAGEAMSQSRTAIVSDHLNQAGDLARESLREARRSMQALRPQALEEKQLSEALKDLIEKMTRGTTVHAKFTLQGKRRKLPPEWETNSPHSKMPSDIQRAGFDISDNKRAPTRRRRESASYRPSEDCPGLASR